VSRAPRPRALVKTGCGGVCNRSLWCGAAEECELQRCVLRSAGGCVIGFPWLWGCFWGACCPHTGMFWVGWSGVLAAAPPLAPGAVLQCAACMQEAHARLGPPHGMAVLLHKPLVGGRALSPAPPRARALAAPVEAAPAPRLAPCLDRLPNSCRRLAGTPHAEAPCAVH
jgi:hypothetical protein